MCNFCDDKSAHELIEFGTMDFGVFGQYEVTGEIIAGSFVGSNLMITINGGNSNMVFNQAKKISFCPMCGRNLKEESVD